MCNVVFDLVKCLYNRSRDLRSRFVWGVVFFFDEFRKDVECFFGLVYKVDNPVVSFG